MYKSNVFLTGQIQCRYHQEMCKGVVSGKHDQLDCKELFPNYHDITKPGMKFMKENEKL